VGYHGVLGVLARGERSGSWGTPVTRGVKSGSGMDNLPIPKRELAKMLVSEPITIRVHTKESKKIVREFVVANDLVFQVQSNEKYKLVNTVDSFIRALTSTQ